MSLLPASLDDRILAACRAATDALPAWRNGWFTGLDVRRTEQGQRIYASNQYAVPDLDRLATAGHLLKGSDADRLRLGTSASIFRLPSA